MFDYDEIRKTIKLFKPDNALFEVRIIGKKTYSGYFTDVEVLIEELKKLPDWIVTGEQFYFTLNKINHGCYAREQKDRILFGKSTTQDKEIVSYKYILIDFDPKRPSGVSSTDKELNKALDLRTEVYLFLRDKGFEEPILALSGNGCHLLYKIDVPNNEENKKYIKNFLEFLDFKYSNNDVEIDTSVYNPARITKLYGTMARKGSNTKERPHRMSKVEITDEVKETPFELIKQVANMLPKPIINPSNNINNFSLERFINRHKIGVKQIINDKNGTKYILESCPFNEEHSKDSPALFRLNNGAIAFKCFHNSCSNNGWKEFRKFYEPDYEVSNANNPYAKTPEKETNTYQGRYLFNISEAPKPKIVSRERTITGIKELDKMVGGFTYDAVTLWASQTNGGKTTLLTMLTDRFISQGKKVFYFNGEQTLDTFRDNLFLKKISKEQINIIEYEDTGIYDDFVSNDVYDNVLKFYANRLYVYNNEAPRDIDTIMMVLTRARSELNIKDFIIDNLMQIDIAGNDKLREQERLAEKLRTFAVNTKSNIHLVVHSRKTVGNSIRLNLFDIAGSQTIANKSYNIITIIRIDQLDKTSAEYERLKNDCLNDGYDIEELDGVLEVLKYKYRRGRTGVVGLKYDKDLGTYIEVEKRAKYEIEIANAERERANTQVRTKPKFHANSKEIY